MARKTTARKSRAKKAAKKRPAKKVSAKKPVEKATADPKTARPGRRIASESRTALATSSSPIGKARERVRKALRACMDKYTTHGDFGWNEGPGTWEMENSAWENVLRCVCQKVGVPLTAPLLKDTKAVNFSRIVDILAGKMVADMMALG